MVKFSELQKHADMLQICGKCGDCGTSGTQITTAKRHVSEPCPVKKVLGFEAYDARGRILIMKKILDNSFKIDDAFLKWAYTCTECASCKETCLAIEGGIDTPLLMEALRQDLVNGEFKLEKHERILESILKNQNPYEEPKEVRFNFLNGELKKFDGDFLLYLGCTSSYRQQNIALASIELLKNLKVNFKIIKDEPCCGSILKRYGYEKDFEKIGKSNLDLLKDKGIKKVIFPCAGCYRTYKIDYKDFNNTNIEFYHLTEFLEEYLKKNPYGFKSQNYKKIAYHDPCHLGRHSGVYESPRTLLRLIDNSNLIELDALRNYSHCCGAGGGVKSSNPALSVDIAKNRNGEAFNKSIDILVSACPFCERNLKDGLSEEFNGLEIVDISEILNNTFQKELSSEVLEISQSNSEVCQNYMKFLGIYPEIFSDLIPGSDMNFAIYTSFVDFEDEMPLDIFHVKRKDEGIEIISGKADDADLELALSKEAVGKLIKTTTKVDYANLFGNFYNEPDLDEGWIDFLLHKRTKTLIDMGYGKFAEAAGILDEEEDAL
ncbi:MAG: (Fe-S)-binding protein [Candidatus Lokiarchaeota archaeon]